MNFITDLRGAWRSLSQAPGFLALATFVLALGLGATIFMFGVINTLMLRPPPFPEAERIDMIMMTVPQESESNEIDYADYYFVRDNQRSYESLGAYYNGTVILSGTGVAERLEGSFVSASIMSTFGVQTALGRAFTADDDRSGAEPVAMLSYDYWRTRFNADPDIVGRVLRLNGRPTTVVGVIPRGFVLDGGEQVWLPIARDRATLIPGDADAIDVNVFGLRRKGVSRAQAAADVQNVATRLEAAAPQAYSGLAARVVSFADGKMGTSGTQIMWIMFGAVWLVLAVACATVASLIFVRANHRIYEAAMRVALGARRGRLVVQMLAESVVIAVLGLLGGLAFASVGLYAIRAAVRTGLNNPLPWWTFDIDWRVVLFSAGAAAIAAVLAGIVPALRASRPDVMSILRDGGRSGTGLRLSRFTTVMVIVELGLSAALLTGAGLLTRTALATLTKDFGVDVKPFMTGRVGLPLANYPEEKQLAFFPRYLAELRAIPGVQGVVVASAMPGVGINEASFGLEGKQYREPADYPRAQEVRTAPGSFEGFRRPLLEGRDFDSRDTGDSLPVIIVNRALVDRYFGGVSPLGRRMRLDPTQALAKWYTIIGVAPNIQHDDTWEPGGGFPPAMYTTVTQQPTRFVTVGVRVAGDPRAFTAAMRDKLAAVDPDLALYFINTIGGLQDRNQSGMRIISGMFSTFAVVAILLAAVGIYGVLAFTTTRRTREFAIRRALGAHDRQILRTVLRSALLQLGIGLALGALLAPMMAGLLANLLQGFSPNDPVVYGGVLLLLVLAALVASWVPALRALRVQPATALRHE